jgi:predicted transcriptional regulator
VSKRTKAKPSTELAIRVVNIDRPGIRKVLGDLEAEIMELIWLRPTEKGTTVRDVFAVLEQRRAIAYTTVMNTMTRLAKKNLLRAEKSDLAYVYRPTYTQDQLVSTVVDRIIKDLLVSFSGETTRALNELTNADATKRLQRLTQEIQTRRAKNAQTKES